MKPRTAIILATVLAIVFGAVAVNMWVRSWDKKGADKTKESKAKDRKIFSKASSGAKRLVVSPRGGPELVFEYVNRKWRLSKPISARADAGRIAGIKDMLSDMVYERILKADGKENDDLLTGLSTPRWVVTMVDELGESRVVKIGKKLSRIGASGAEVYVQVGEKVYVVGEGPAKKSVDKLPGPINANVPPGPTDAKKSTGSIDTGTLRGSIDDFRSTKVFDVTSDDILAISVAGAKSYSLSKADNTWRVDKPVKVNADDTKAVELAGKIESLKVAEYVTDSPGSLVRYGLDKPVLEVTIEAQLPAPKQSASQPTSQAASQPTTAAAPRPTVHYTVFLGRKTDRDSKVFARLADEKGVFTVAVAALGDLQPKLIDLRDKKIAKVSRSMTSRIELDIAGAKGTLIRRGRFPRWTVELPRKGKGDKAAIDTLRAAIGKLEVKGDKGAIDTVLAAVGKLEAKSDKAAIDTVLAAVEKLQVKGDKEAIYALLAAIGKFEAKGDKETIDALLKAIWELEAKGFDDTPGVVELRSLASPRARIMVQSFTSAMLGRPKPDGPKITLRVGAKRSDGVAVMREGGPVALVEKDKVKVLLQRPAKYMDPTLLDFVAAQPREKITAITLLRLKTKPVKLAVRTDGNWQMKAPVDVEADRDNVITLLDRLETFKATEIVAVGPKAHEDYAKSNAKIALEVTTESQVAIPTSQPTTGPASQPASKPAPKFKTLVKKYRIHVVLSGIRAYAWIGGRDITVVGEFESKLFAELSGEYRSRRLWELDPKDVSSIKIMPGKDEHVLRRQGDTWRYTANTSFKVDSKKVETFLKDLKDLKALRFVAHGRAGEKELKTYGLDDPWLRLVLTTAKGLTHRIVVAARGPDKKSNIRYAMVDGINGVFLLKDFAKLAKLPEVDFEKE